MKRQCATVHVPQSSIGGCNRIINHLRSCPECTRFGSSSRKHQEMELTPARVAAAEIYEALANLRRWRPEFDVRAVDQIDAFHTGFGIHTRLGRSFEQEFAAKGDFHDYANAKC